MEVQKKKKRKSDCQNNYLNSLLQITVFFIWIR